jgi:hypothetical protein
MEILSTTLVASGGAGVATASAYIRGVTGKIYGIAFVKTAGQANTLDLDVNDATLTVELLNVDNIVSSRIWYPRVLEQQPSGVDLATRCVHACVNSNILVTIAQANDGTVGTLYLLCETAG